MSSIKSTFDEQLFGAEYAPPGEDGTNSDIGKVRIRSHPILNRAKTFLPDGNTDDDVSSQLNSPLAAFMTGNY